MSLWMATIDIPELLATRIGRESHLEARLADQDRSFGYEFIVGVVRDAKCR